MALLTIGGYAVPPPLSGSYATTTEDVGKFEPNAKGVTIGEFVRTRKHITWSYDKLTAADYAAINTAIRNNTAGTGLSPVSIVYLDMETNTFMTGNFIRVQNSAVYYRHLAGLPVHKNITFEMIEQ